MVYKLSKIVNVDTFSEHREGIEPSLPHYECGVLPLDHQCALSISSDSARGTPDGCCLVSRLHWHPGANDAKWDCRDSNPDPTG